jgi:tRNA-splicing ligase RtcB
MIEKLRRIDDTKIEIPVDYKPGMRVRGVIYVDEVLEKELETQSVDQVANVATLPGIVKSSMAMPDVHTGYGFAIGVWRPDAKDGSLTRGVGMT